MPLTHYALLSAQPREKTYKLFDGHGLYLQVAPTGGKWWRVKYRFGGREQCLSVGTFPAVALKAARQRCEELRAKLASRVDPAAERRLAKQQLRTKDESFEVIAREWYATFSPNWAPSHGDRVLRRLETYVFPWVGKVPIREVTAMNVLECLRRLEHQNTPETARRVLRYCSQTLRYAIVTGRAETDVLGQLRGALAPRKTRHLASVKDPKRVGALLKAIDGYDGRLVTKLALNELGWSSDAIERQLAHGERDGVRAVYNHAQYLPERRRMMQAWLGPRRILVAAAAGRHRSPTLKGRRPASECR